MVVFSKNRFTISAHNQCSLLHPWSDSCYATALGTGLMTIRGSSKFFFLIYLIPLLLKRNYKREVLIQSLITFGRSCLFGGFCGSSSIATMCFLRWLLGKHKMYSLGLIPGMVGGCAIFLEHPMRREIDVTLLIALVADLYLKLFNDEEIVKLTLAREMFIFSACTSLLLYCLRSIKGSCTVLWPFPPPKVSNEAGERKHCSHDDTCLESVKQGGKKFFCFGLALQAIKVVTFNFEVLFKNPTDILRVVFAPKNLRLPIFTGLYITLLKGVCCLLVKCRGQDEPWHALPAGVVASLTYLIHPNFSLALIAFSNLSQIVCREFTKDMKWLPQLPWRELVFIFILGLLFHARAAYPQCFPRYMTAIMDTATNGRAKDVYELVDRHIIIRQ